MKRWLAGLVLSLLLTLFAASPVMAAPTVDDVAQKLICQCGCTAVLNNCTHAECTSRETMLGIVKQKIAQGQSADQIVQSFVSQYGEKVLSEPPKSGFNLTAWLTPFISLAAGGVIIYLALKRWLRRRKFTSGVMPEIAERNEVYRQRLEQELKEFPERGFR